MNDETLHQNQQNGLHYSYYSTAHYHAYFFNYDEFVFEFTNTKACQELDHTVNQGGCGPVITAIYKWKNSEKRNGWELDKINERCDLCSEYDNDDRSGYSFLEKPYYCSFLKEPCYCPLKDMNLSSINKERFLALSLGELTFKHWPDVNSIFFFTTDEGYEVNRSLTFLHDLRGRNYKYTTMGYYFALCEIIKEGNFPDCISDLKGNCVLKYIPIGIPHEKNDTYLYNLYSTKNKMKASVAYVANKDYRCAAYIYDQMCELFWGSQSKKRVVVWFKSVSGKITPFCDDTSEKITDRPIHSNYSFLKGGKLSESK